MVMVAALVLGIAPAWGQSMGLDPQNRVHLGVNYVDGVVPFGVTGGFDSRITRIVSMDIGGFVSPVPVERDYAVEADAYGDYLRLRHGIYFTPGIRIPHPQPQSWAWDVFVRGGGGVVWVSNIDPERSAGENTNHEVRAAPGGTAGLDLQLTFGGKNATRWGARAFGRGWIYGGIRESPPEAYTLVRPQAGLEALVQW